jgi:hypothetical protein
LPGKSVEPQSPFIVSKTASVSTLTISVMPAGMNFFVLADAHDDGDETGNDLGHDRRQIAERHRHQGNRERD